MHSYISSPLLFLIDTLFYLYMVVVALRMVMQWARWEHYSPIVQFIIKATQQPVSKLRRFIPQAKQWDTASFTLLLLLAFAKLLLLTLISGMNIDVIQLIRLALADVFALFIGLYTASIIIQAVVSWITPAGSHNPLMPLLQRMNAPLLNPARRHLPDMGGLDLSPLAVLLGLQLLSMLVLPLLTGQFAPETRV
jgi:YggT family protein